MEEDKLKRIQESAIKIFMEKGYKETKIQDIAKLAEISPGTIYLYYKNKRELFSSLNIPEAEQLRPRYDEKRLEILKTALSIFGINGYSATSMEVIASACGFSKAVLYQYFNNKEELFKAIFESEVSKNFKVSSIDTNASDIYQVLTEIAYKYYEMLIQPEKLNLIRVIIGESGKFPEIGKILYENGINKMAESLSEYLEKNKEVKIAQGLNTKILAMNFMGDIISCIIINKLIYPNDNEFNKDEVLNNIVSVFEKSLRNK